MKIIVPMAGRGSRLRPHTLTVPKPLIPIAGKPIVHRLVEDIAKVLNETRKQWSGTVKLIFQPGEETLPGGASLMIDEGVLRNPDVDLILGQHVSPELLSGTVGIREGLFMASADELYLTVNGVGGHAAIPQSNINPLKIAAKII